MAFISESMGWGQRSAYDESLRVPLLVRYPALGAVGAGRVVDEMVLNLDLAQTLLDFAGCRRQAHAGQELAASPHHATGELEQSCSTNTLPRSRRTPGSRHYGSSDERCELIRTWP